LSRWFGLCNRGDWFTHLGNGESFSHLNLREEVAGGFSELSERHDFGLAFKEFGISNHAIRLTCDNAMSTDYL